MLPKFTDDKNSSQGGDVNNRLNDDYCGFCSRYADSMCIYIQNGCEVKLCNACDEATDTHGTVFFGEPRRRRIYGAY